MVFVSVGLLQAAPGNKDCPVSGKAVSKSVDYAKTVAFCCDKCKAKFEADPDKYIGKVKKG